jgi:hypothetical protein
MTSDKNWTLDQDPYQYHSLLATTSSPNTYEIENTSVNTDEISENKNALH